MQTGQDLIVIIISKLPRFSHTAVRSVHQNNTNNWSTGSGWVHEHYIH